ncbi:NAD-dependent isocitrate dehydrogenase [Puccinia graminis f. sp. tritici]|uniref:NAD-dependent isocitrate dehydrogenase n=1 Tax=Puccinia graminis f. sp. tritici TaxID=56615 RepID=A0A5B0SCI0_PUCGR|nr:NAD-dependent isocitrate dehydrogenase [Puccinia graminis f. sp. tritici]KAA1135552.1 NAD-dependent isocitrate dehydrogenase [Puccinia graminis f. sp. tritici]
MTRDAQFLMYPSWCRDSVSRLRNIRPAAGGVWCIKPRWAQSQVPLGRAPRGPGSVPRGLDWATRAGLRSWHTAKSCLADPKRWADEIFHTTPISPPHLVRHTITSSSRPTHQCYV